MKTTKVGNRATPTREKKGRDTNLASEFYVLSALYRLGADAYLTLGNKKSVDIVVVRAPGDTVTIDVKAVADRVDWPVGSGDQTPRANHFIVLMTFDGNFGDLASTPITWVLPHEVWLGMIKSAKAPSKMRYLSRREVLESCAKWRDAWKLVCAV